MSTRPRISTRTLLASLAAGSVLATATVGGVAPTNADAAESINGAYGVAAEGTDPHQPTPLVTSNGKMKTARGNASGNAGTFRATGMTVKAAAGIAETRVGNLTVGGENFGSISATCRNGIVTNVTHSGTKPSKPNMRAYYGSTGGSKVIGITVQILGADNKPAQTVTAAAVRCAKGTPPSDDPAEPPSSTPKPDQPGNGADDGGDTGSSSGGDNGGEQDAPAPAPTPADGHHPVTG